MLFTTAAAPPPAAHKMEMSVTVYLYTYMIWRRLGYFNLYLFLLRERAVLFSRNKRLHLLILFSFFKE